MLSKHYLLFQDGESSRESSGEGTGEVTAEGAVEGVADSVATETTSSVLPPPGREPDKPGALAVFWCFVSSFFTSLVPQQPAGVNGN